MKIFLLFLFTIVVVPAAPHASASDKHELQRVILAEIIQSIKELNDRLTAEIFVPKVITNENCNYFDAIFQLKTFCKAGNILSAYKAEEFGLDERDWLLPRKLVAYTRDIQCKDPASEDRNTLRQLLNNLHQCAQKEYANI